MILKGLFVPFGDQNDVLNSRFDQFFNNKLNDRLVDDRKHFFWHCLRNRQKPGPRSGDGDDSFFDLHGFMNYELDYKYTNTYFDK